MIWARTQIGSNIKALPDHLKGLLFVDDPIFPPKRSLIYTPFIKGGHYGHNSANYEKVLKVGLRGIAQEAQEKLAGYSAYYTRIFRALQDGIIARTKHRV